MIPDTLANASTPNLPTATHEEIARYAAGLYTENELEDDKKAKKVKPGVDAFAAFNWAPKAPIGVKAEDRG